MVLKIQPLAVDPTREYEGTVYSQRVVVELEDGTILGVFDPNTLVSASDVGEALDIRLGFLVEDIEQVNDERFGVDPAAEEPEGWAGHTYTGELTDIETDSKHATLSIDVGIGTVEVQAETESADSFAIGDAVRIRARRSDIAETV